MAKIAVIKTGGKQYLVRENEELLVNKLDSKENEVIDLETLAVIDDQNNEIELGSPAVKSVTKAQIIAQVKGDKVRVAKFKAKVRYRKVIGFREKLTKIKITQI